MYVTWVGSGKGHGPSCCEDVHSGEDPFSKSPSYDLVKVIVLCFTEEVFLKVDFYNVSRNKSPKFERTTIRVVFLLSMIPFSSTDNTTRPAECCKSNWMETVQNLYILSTVLGWQQGISPKLCVLVFYIIKKRIDLGWRAEGRKSRKTACGLQRSSELDWSNRLTPLNRDREGSLALRDSQSVSRQVGQL